MHAILFSSTPLAISLGSTAVQDNIHDSALHIDSQSEATPGVYCMFIRFQAAMVLQKPAESMSQYAQLLGAKDGISSV